MHHNETIDELKKQIADLKLQLAEQKVDEDYKLFFENNEAIILILDPISKDILFVNEAASKFYGYSREEFCKLKIFDINVLPKEDIETRIDKTRKTNQNHFNLRHRVANGEIKDVEIFQTKLNLNNKEVFSLIVHDVTEKNNIEKELELWENRYREYFDEGISGVYLSTPEGKLINCNNSFANMLGYSIEELRRINTKNLYSTPEDRTRIVEQVKKNRILKNAEINLICKNGTTINCLVNIVGKYDKDDNLVQFNGYIFNVTDLRKSEARFKRLFEDLGDAVYVTRIGGENRGDILEVNAAAVKQSGYSREELLNMNIVDDLYVEGSGNITTEKWDNLLHGIDPVEGMDKKRRKDGTEFWTEVIVTPIEFNGEKAGLSINHDITSRKNIEEALAKSEKKFRELFEKSGDAFLIIKNRKFVDCNIAAVNLLKWGSKEDFLFTHPSKLSPEFQPDGMNSIEKANLMMDLCVQHGNHRFEWDHVKSDGTIVPVEVLLTSISNNPNEEIIHTVWRDITHQKRINSDLVKAKEKAEESDRLKSAFLANMSHEIRTPMNGILGFASLLKLPDLNEEQLKKYVTIIEKSGARMLNIINDLMDISKIESGQMEVNNEYCNINEQLNNLHSFFNNEAKNADLKLTRKNGLSDNSATIYTDISKLDAVLSNLIKNAIKYCDEGEIEFGYNLKDGELLFYVRDTGEGIPKERHEAIFDRFVQADIEDKKAKEGAGLGLAISKAYTEMLGGEIWVESEEYAGTTFYFTIPYVTKKIKDPKRNKAKKKKNIKVKRNKNMKKILIVDDEMFASSFLEIVLKPVTDNILKAYNGEEAIEAAKENPDLSLILMDMKMPIVDGYSATKEIRKFNKNVIIIAQTAFALPGDKEKALSAGCNDYISKPIDKKELIEKVKSYFQEMH